MYPHYLKLPSNSHTLSTLGSLFYNTTTQSYQGYTDNGWVSLSESPSSDVSFANNITINKNLNVIQNINVTDTITTKSVKLIIS